jgi:hypothetical protein
MGGFHLSASGNQVRGDIPQRGRRPIWIRFLPLEVAAVAVLVFLVWPVATIQLRLSRNGAIARQLAEALHTRFPGADFRGVASYEREVIFISVLNRVDESVRRDVEEYLRAEKTERRIELEIWLRFLGDEVPDIKF